MWTDANDAAFRTRETTPSETTGIEKRRSAGKTPGGLAAGRVRTALLFRRKDGLFGGKCLRRRSR
jgi:hypothetical protein